MATSRAWCRRIGFVVAMLVGLSGCGGTKILKEPQPLAVQEALATGSDARVAVNLGWIIVRDGPGTWAKNADWDEYLVTLRNHSDGPVAVTAVTVVDSSETRHGSIASRKKLVKASRQTPLPLQVEPGHSQAFDLFFPIAPSPLEVRVDYTDSSGTHTIVMDTREVLEGLHLPQEEAARLE